MTKNVPSPPLSSSEQRSCINKERFRAVQRQEIPYLSTLYNPNPLKKNRTVIFILDSKNGALKKKWIKNATEV